MLSVKSLTFKDVRTLEEEEHDDKDAEEEAKVEGAEEKAAREKAEYERDAALRQKRFADHMRVSPGAFLDGATRLST
jgi:predicted HNH restriction endonuclease